MSPSTFFLEQPPDQSPVNLRQLICLISVLIHDVCSVSVLITIKTLLGQIQMITPHFISQWYLQKEPPKMLSRLAKSFPLVEIQDFFFFGQTI